jgi:hypothetical protein
VNTFRVKNFESFQHYKDRSPPWIKLYNELLDDYDFGALPDASKFHLVAIWLLASRSANKIPFDPAWIGRRINATSKIDLDILVERGFILLDQPLQTMEQDASKPQAERLTREREEGEAEKKDIRAKRPNESFEEFWNARPRRKGPDPKEPSRARYEAAIKSGVAAEDLLAAVKRYAALEVDHIGTPYLRQTVKWLKDKSWADYPFISEEIAVLDWDNVVKMYTKTQHWSRWAGPEPGQLGCRAPAEILHKYGIRIGDPEGLYTDIAVAKVQNMQ